MIIDIKDIQGQTRVSAPIQEGAKGKFSLMQEDYIILPFSVKEPVSFKMGDYVDLSETLGESLKDKFGKIYEVVDKQSPTYNSSTGGYDYQLKLDAYYWKWKNKIFRYTPENTASEASWSLTAALDVQLGVFLRNLKALGYTYRGSDFTFSIDSTVEDKAVAMTYDNINLLDALFSMAGEDKWNCDCWITDNVIHFGRCEFGDAVKIERDVEAALISKTESKGDYGTRIIAFGSTNNIPTSYRKKFIDTISFIQGDLRFTGKLSNTNYYLEQGQRTDIRILTGVDSAKTFNVRWDSGNFYFESGVTCNASVGDKFEVLNYSYKVPDRYLSYGADDFLLNGVVQRRLMLPEDTPYIDLYEGMTDDEAIEKIVTFDDVFPRMDGVLSDVHTRTAEEENEDGTKETVTYYRYKDSGLEFKEEYRLEGQELKIQFQSGKLNGMEFGVIFNPEPKDEERGEQLWEIVLNENYGRRLPDDIMYPATGDKYVLLGFDTRYVSTLYIPDAEQELKEKTQKYVELIRNNDGTFPVTLKSTWVYENISSRLYGLGQRINLVDDTYFENGRLSRVLGYEINLDYPWDSPIYTIGESASYSRIQELEDKVDALVYKGQTYVGTGGSGGANIYVIKSNDGTQASDDKVFSALRSLKMFLRKDQSDQTNYLMKFGEFIDSLIAGKGTGIFPDGRIQTDRLEVRGSMTVKDLIINEIHAMAGDWSLSDCGTIDKVEFVSDSTYKLWIRKETETDWTSLDEEDVMYSIVNNLKIGGTDYYTSWMRVVTKNINDNTLTVVLWPDSEVPGGKNYPPVAGYNVTRRGNSRIPGEGEPTNERTQSWLLSSREGRIMFLQNVYKPILEDYNYGLSIGKIPKLKALEHIPVSEGELGIVAQTIITQNFYEFDYNGNVISKRVPRGAWSLETAQGAYPYRFITKEYESENGTEYTQLEQHTVEHYGCTWGCIVDQTQDEPMWNSPGWVMLQGDQNYHLEFESSNGWQFFLNQVNTDVTAIVSYGNRDITNVLMTSTGVEVEWLRDTGNVPADNSWKPTYVDNQKNVIHLSVSDMGSGWGQEYRKVSFICKVFIPVGEDFETAENRINIKI